jgi:hypothetical protein
MKTLVKPLLYIIGGVLVVALTIAGHSVERWWNNYLYYDSASKDVVLKGAFKDDAGTKKEFFDNKETR